MTTGRNSEPKHLSVDLTTDEYATIQKTASESGKTLNEALFSALLVKLGATMQWFVSKNGLQDVVIEVHIEAIEDDITQDDLDVPPWLTPPDEFNEITDDTTQDDLDALDDILSDVSGFALGLFPLDYERVIDFSALDGETEITDLDEWEQSS